MNAQLKKLLARQEIRFLIVGGVNTVVGYGLFALFYKFLFFSVPFGYVLSLVLSYALAIVLAFNLHRRFVFVVTGQLWTDFWKFVAVNAVSIGINIAALPLLVEILGMQPLVAQAIIVAVTTLVSFFGHREISFRRSAASSETTDAPEIN